jgi:hypothetical protein
MKLKTNKSNIFGMTACHYVHRGEMTVSFIYVLLQEQKYCDTISKYHGN